MRSPAHHSRATTKPSPRLGVFSHVRGPARMPSAASSSMMSHALPPSHTSRTHLSHAHLTRQSVGSLGLLDPSASWFGHAKFLHSHTFRIGFVEVLIAKIQNTKYKIQSAPYSLPHYQALTAFLLLTSISFFFLSRDPYCTAVAKG